jgi:hypothetical protein
MATGRSRKIVGQTGEYLVAAELSRRGLIATTFTGNVPHYDIIASDENGKHVSVQVKASKSASWQFGDISHYCNISFKDKQQIVGDLIDCPVQRLIVVFVNIDEYRQDTFFILTWKQLQKLLVNHYKTYLEKHDGVRPRKWDSKHCGIKETDLLRYRDKWETIDKNLK